MMGRMKAIVKLSINTIMANDGQNESQLKLSITTIMAPPNDGQNESHSLWITQYLAERQYS